MVNAQRQHLPHEKVSSVCTAQTQCRTSTYISMNMRLNWLNDLCPMSHKTNEWLLRYVAPARWQ